LAEHPAPSEVVFLGDNFYPSHADERIAPVLERQLAVLPARERVHFVAGNHDWHDRGFRASRRFATERVAALAAAAGAQWQPPPGDLGPVAIAPAHGLYRVLAIDSERWRIAASQCARRGADCEARSAAEQRLAAALDCPGCAPAVVVAHHPLRTVGEHGGCEASWLRRHLQVGGQDLHTAAYQAYLASLGRALAAHPPLLYAAGHDHSLQLALDSAAVPHVVSGAGAKRSPVCGAPDASWSRNGFVALDFTRGAAPLVRVFAIDDDGALREVRRAPLP
jgi:hypothetical protein